MAGDIKQKATEMKYYCITIGVKVPDNITLKEAEEYFQYATGYSWSCRPDNPLLGTETETTDFDITELN